jgi:hypothetical protein
LPACQSNCAGNDDCGANEVCLTGTGKCAVKCTPGKAGNCSASTTCDPCATSTCPACDDCVAACVEPPGGGGQQGGW